MLLKISKNPENSHGSTSRMKTQKTQEQPRKIKRPRKTSKALNGSSNQTMLSLKAKK